MMENLTGPFEKQSTLEALPVKQMGTTNERLGGGAVAVEQLHLLRLCLVVVSIVIVVVLGVSALGLLGVVLLLLFRRLDLV